MEMGQCSGRLGHIACGFTTSACTSQVKKLTATCLCEWCQAAVQKHIKGIDLSPSEVDEAWRRFQEMRVKRQEMN